MNKVLSAFLLCLFCFFNSYAQEFKITGTILDVHSKQPLEVVTIYAESIKDSSLAAYTFSDAAGFFVLEVQLRLKEVNLFISYNGYKTLSMKIAVNPELKLGIVELIS